MTTELTCSLSLDQSSALITRCHPMKQARCGPICANVDGTARRRKRSPGIRCRIENCVQSFTAVFDLARSRDPSSRWLRNIADIASPFELRRSPTTVRVTLGAWPRNSHADARPRRRGDRVSNCVVGSGASWLPCSTIAEHSVEGCDHFSHDGHDDDLGFFVGGGEAFVE